MNPKNLNDLDPKLRDAYEKVMGTNFNPAPAATQQEQQNTPSVQAAPQQNTPLMQTQPAEEQPPVIQTVPVQPPLQNPQPSPLPMQNPFAQTPIPPPTVLTQAGSYSAPQQVQKKHFSFMPIVFLLGGGLFFAAYAVIWAKIFGLF
ncbi:MAG: hypothetical protein A2798_03305 [Candidatus Levybacteria bacterium RIFCSPHIGHO2_01_FULL_37_17]|nr:MAG: hypothetical protein A2798_03305 [Candidatus Levybacteria bacterium RIFCSPHIGHO2_01_FULL_37_17]OGH36882.1 MAG: hypothetical protein A2959_01295 [Candidatus Levybacteria bacterium RIFCSPLOWO2_01_FULL_38_23]